MAPTSRGDTAHLALLSVCQTLRALLASAARDEVATRHRVGTTLLEVRDATDKYGKRSIERAAEHLGASVRLLYDYIAVAESWTASGLEVQLRKMNRFHQPLTWSHFVALSRVKDATWRQRLADESTAHAWSVRELAEKIEEYSAAPSRSGDAARAGEAARAAIKEGLQRGGRWRSELQLFGTAIESRLFDPNEPVDEDELDRVIDLYDDLHDRTASTLDRLREVRRSRTRLKVAVAAPASVRREAEEGSVTEAPLRVALS